MNLTGTLDPPGLTEQQEEDRVNYVAFAAAHIAPAADRMHREQHTPPELIEKLGQAGLLAVCVPEKFGGSGKSAVSVGLLAAEVGRACSSIRSLLTVHWMVSHVLARWGTRDQRQTWLPRLATGETIAALALSEPGAGSDAASITTTIEPDGEELVVHGVKSWITYGQTADVFLVIGQGPDGPVAALVERDRPGVTTTPVLDLVGIRASMTAEVTLDRVRVPAGNLVGRRGMGLVQVAGTALDLGRYTVAWGCVGIVDACLRASAGYAARRTQFGVTIDQHQLVRRMITDMTADLHTSRLACLDAGRRRDRLDPSAFEITSMAKYVASRAASRATADALQVHGANGCSADFPLQRYRGDAAVMEVIEGSTQIHQVGLADLALREYGPTEAATRVRTG